MSLNQRFLNQTAIEKFYFQHAIHKIILQENNKLSAEDDAHGNNDFEIYGNNLYEIDNMGLDENIQWHRRAFESKLENLYWIEIQNYINYIHGN